MTILVISDHKESSPPQKYYIEPTGTQIICIFPLCVFVDGTNDGTGFLLLWSCKRGHFVNEFGLFGFMLSLTFSCMSEETTEKVLLLSVFMFSLISYPVNLPCFTFLFTFKCLLQFGDLWAQCRLWGTAEGLLYEGPGQLRISTSSVHTECHSVWCWSRGQVKRSLEGWWELTSCQGSSLGLCRSVWKRPESYSSDLRRSRAALHIATKLFARLMLCIFPALLSMFRSHLT